MAFIEPKKALLQAPALGIPNAEKPFHLYFTEREELAIGVFTQALGPTKRPVGYLSKQLNTVARGWLHCLRVIIVEAILIEALKIIIGQEIILYTSYQINSVLNLKGPHWLTTAY